MAYGTHYSVMYKECIHYLTEGVDWSEERFFADMTFGAAGHTRRILEFDKNSRVIAVDQDPDAIENGQKIINENSLENKLFLHKMNFVQFPVFFKENYHHIIEKNGGLQGILLDLGVSSHQFDTPERGFSFKDGPLDMRMNFESTEKNAADLLAELSEEEIADLIFEYGEEHYSRQIAKNIVEFRNIKRIETTKELEDIIFHSYPKRERFQGIHPATKTFQALRIAVNRELDVLRDVLADLFDLLAPGGRLLVISFHSLEDRIVKNKFKEIRDCNKKMVKLITKRPLRPTDEEVEENKRSRSAKLRIIEKVSEDALIHGVDYGSQKKKSKKWSKQD